MSEHIQAGKPRLLVLTSTYPRWFADPEPGFVHELSRRMTADFEVVVLGPHAPGALAQETLDGVHVRRYRYAPERWETLVNDGGIVTNLKRQPWKWLLVPGFFVSMYWSAWLLLRRWRPDVIHAHWLIPQGLVAALLGWVYRATPPFLVTSHGTDLYGLRARPLQALKRFIVQRAAVTTVVSYAMREELVRLGIDTDKVQVQSMGVDLSERFTPDVSVPRSRYEILFVGRLVENKGLRHLIGAIPKILKFHPAARLTVVGSGPERVALRTQAENLGVADRIDFLGPLPQSQLPALYRRAAVFVAPFSGTEGLGLVLVEALGCGCPVVTTRLPAVHEVFEGHWPSTVVDPEQAKDLAEAIGRVLTVPEQIHSEMRVLQDSLKARFDWRHIAAGYASRLRLMMGGRAS